MIKEIVYDVDILNHEYWVKVYIGKDLKKLEKLLTKHFDDGSWTINKARGTCFTKTEFAPFVWVDTKFCKTRKDVYATLSHEAVHAIDFIFNAIGSKDRDEVFAHSVAAIVRKYR